ncbi:Hsp70 family protein [Chloroflexi bacterium TSY]|nr:Hsp70 family protein [Chloroflexi bacterium TSY]
MTDKILGIDLGTTNSALSVVQDGIPKLLPIHGKTLLPSVVGISSSGETLVGTPAHNQWVVAPERTIRSIKRKMGSGESVSMGEQTYTPQEISAFILRAIKQAAAEALGYAVERAVITVPAYFNEVQRQATLEAGEIAGLRVERIINEPTAAALAYGLGQDSDEHLHIMVYDLGGGTFDVSIIELNFGVVDVLATAGDNHLGGDDFDEALAKLLADEFQEEHEIDLTQNHQAWARLIRSAEEAKIELSSNPHSTVNLEYIAEDADGNPLHIQREIARDEFVGLIDTLLTDTITCIDNALKDANLNADAIDRILLVGGSTRIPAVAEKVELRMDQAPHSEIDPDAAVALGAAVQAGIIAGEEIDAILVDVTPLSLGIETATFTMHGGIESDHFSPLIRRNTAVPVQKSEGFSTLHPNQDTIHVKVYQGESPIASQNVLLGDFRVEELKPDPTDEDGFAHVNINFQLDINGILDVTVTDRATGKQVTEQLKASRQRLSPDEIVASQAKLDEIAADGSTEKSAESTLDPTLSALLGRAEAIQERSDVDEDLRAEILEVAESIRKAAEANNQQLAAQYSDELVDLLFEAEDED